MYLTNLVGLKEAEAAYTQPPAIPKLDKVERILRYLKDIDAHLLKKLGMSKTTLAYVVREQVMIIPSSNDLSGEYLTVK